jgi:tetratricopeptide (TPR) repeat protein
MTMYIDLWNWFDSYGRQARSKGDRQRINLTEIATQGWRYMRVERMEEAKVEFQKGVELAAHLHEAWWEVFFEYRICEVCERLSEYQETLDRSIKLVTKLQRPQLAEHPYRASAHMMVVWGYYLIDACGYRPEIEAAMDYIEDHIPMDRITHMEIYYIRSGIAQFFDEYDKAYAYIMEYMDAAQGDSGEEKRVYQLLSDYYYATGVMEQALEAERQCAYHSKQGQSLRWEAIAIGWQSVRLAWLGRKFEAAMQFELGKKRLEDLDLHRLVPAMSVHYLIACGRDAEAWEFTDRAMQVAAESRSLDKLLAWHMTRGYLLNRLQRPVLDEMAAARRLVQQFRTPEHHLKKLECIEQGRHYEYDWQIQQRKVE